MTTSRNIRYNHKEKRRRLRKNNKIKSKQPQIYSIPILIEIHLNPGSVCYSISINLIYLSKILKIPNSREVRKASQLWAVTKV